MKWVTNTTLSWGPGVKMTYPASGSRCAMSAAKYPAAQRLAMLFSFTVEATHLPPAPDMFSCAEKTWAWVLELKGARVVKGEGRRG